MPQISKFFGIIIRMFFDDHKPPHFHASYGEYDCIIEIESLSLIAGYIPPRALGLIIEWGMLHKDELNANWLRMTRREPFKAIEPLE